MTVCSRKSLSQKRKKESS